MQLQLQLYRNLPFSTFKKTVTINVDNCTLIVKMVDSCTIVIVVASPLHRNVKITKEIIFITVLSFFYDTIRGGQTINFAFV